MPKHTADAEHTQDESRQGLQPADAGDDFDAVWDEISTQHNSSTGEPDVRPDAQPAGSQQGPGRADSGMDGPRVHPDGPDPSQSADPNADPGGQPGGQPAVDPNIRPANTSQGPVEDFRGNVADLPKDELLRRAQGYNSMGGRLNQTRQELESERQAKKELEERLARYEQQSQGPPDPQQAPPADPGTPQAADRPQDEPVQPAQPAQSAQPAKADIPEELQDEVSEFQRRYPDYADLVETNSPQAEQVRALLREYGPDMAAVKADAVILREQMQAETSQVRSSVEETRQSIAQKEAQEHWGRIGSKYPELQRLQADQDRGQDYQAFLGRLNTWIEEQPLRQARQITAVIQQGTADQVLQVLDAYAEANAQDSVLTNGEHNGEHRGEHKVRPYGPDADAAAAVPSRPGPPPNPNPNKDDFEAAWEARTRQAKT